MRTFLLMAAIKYLGLAPADFDGFVLKTFVGLLLIAAFVADLQDGFVSRTNRN